MKFHVNWGHASAQQLKQEFMDLDGNHAHLLTRVDGVLAQREVRQTFGKALHVLVAGTSTVAKFHEKLEVDLQFSDGVIAPHAMGTHKFPSARRIPRRFGMPFTVL